jgi:hypothetical protein
VLVTICGPTHGSNVISLMWSTIILGGLTSGSPCMSEVFINVCCVFSFRMMIQANSVFELFGGTFPWNPLIAWACVDLGPLKHVQPRGVHQRGEQSYQIMACLDLHCHCSTFEPTKPSDETTILKMESRHH